MKSGLVTACALIFCLLLPSCGGDSLCERAWKKIEECSGGGSGTNICGAISDCPDCKNEWKEYAECVVEKSSCVDISRDCRYEFSDWAYCMEDSPCGT